MAKARRLWRIYLEGFRTDSRVRWATLICTSVGLFTALPGVWTVMLLAVTFFAAYAIHRTKLIEPEPKPEDFEDWF
jgi:uncharacterized membrane protein